MKKRPSIPLADFKGFDDYIEVFRAGTHLGSDNKPSTWSIADLDQMVANHQAAPIVVGHPKTDSPAYGWTHSLKRDGDVLLAKFADVDAAFAKMVAERRFPNRSIRIVKNKNGLALGHVGFLGATPPAVEGLKPIEFNAELEHFDFSTDWQTPYALKGLNRILSGIRDLLIEKFGAETSDKAIPKYELDSLLANADELFKQAERGQIEEMDRQEKNSSNFNQGGDMETQEELDAERQKVADFSQQNQQLQQQLEAERRKARKTECQAFVDSLLQKGVKPAALAGVAEFMAALPAEAETFEFSQGEGDKAQTIKTSQVDFFKGILNQLPTAVKTGELDFSAGETVNSLNVDSIVKAATAYQFAQSQKGISISISDAVSYVTKGVK